METLSIIAYKQPITKSEVEHIRGVNCDYAIHKLLEKEMVSISGKSEGPGRPVLYSTSKNFMDYFGLQNPKDLPQLKDLHMEQNEIGVAGEFVSEENQESVSVSEELIEEMHGLEVAEDSISVTAEQDEREILQAENESDIAMVSDDTNVEASDEMPPVMGEEEGMILPDRKAIFIGSQVDSTDIEFEEQSSDDILGEDDSEITS